MHRQTVKGNFSTAVAQCDEIGKKYPKYRTEALRHKGKLLLSMDMPQEAEEIYATIIKTHAIPWARLGLVHSLHKQRKFVEAEALL